jgi:hypothetical protein
MKKNLFLALWALSLSQVSRTQSNFSFPTAHAEWVVHQVYPVVGPTDIFTVFRQFLQGDSVFLGKTYTKVYEQNMCYCLCTSQATNYIPMNSQPYLLGGVREENEKIYFTKFGAGTGEYYFSPLVDTLLYDFTAQPGDTIPYANDYVLVVDLVDTTYDGRKRINFKIYPPGFPGHWTEGIGSRGLLETTTFLYINDFCFSDEEPSTCSIPCEATATEELVSLPGIRVKPALASDFVRVECSDPSERYALQIFSIGGALLDNRRNIGSDDSIAIGHLPPGILVFQFQSTKGIVSTTKIVKYD